MRFATGVIMICHLLVYLPAYMEKTILLILRSEVVDYISTSVTRYPYKTPDPYPRSHGMYSVMPPTRMIYCPYIYKGGI